MEPRVGYSCGLQGGVSVGEDRGEQGHSLEVPNDPDLVPGGANTTREIRIVPKGGHHG